MEKIKFHFNTDLPNELRYVVNEKQNLSLDKEGHLKGIGKYLAWDRICAIMDRIEDTINHLNAIELGDNDNRAAFDFYEFISCSAVLIDCIKSIGNIFNIDSALIKEIEDSQQIFGEKYSANGTDGKFFEYVRSLCAIHPTHTNRQKVYLRGAQFHCCPFVTWNHILGIRKDGDLTATVYTSKHGEHPIFIPLYVNQFKNYVDKWVLFLKEVIEAIKIYNDSVYEKFRNTTLKKLSDFNGSVVEYLKYLKDEYSKRFGDQCSYCFDEYIKVFNITLTNEENKQKLEKYRNAILYSMEFLINGMQNMSFEEFENSGIEYPDALIETFLFLELSHPFSLKSEFTKFSYNLEKIYYLEQNSSYSYWDKKYARGLLEEVKPSINKFIVFENNESDEETMVLIQLARYLDALNNKNLLNKNIPNEEKYRIKTLSSSDWESLFEEVIPEDSESNGMSLEEILKMYGD